MSWTFYWACLSMFGTWERGKVKERKIMDKKMKKNDCLVGEKMRGK